MQSVTRWQRFWDEVYDVLFMPRPQMMRGLPETFTRSNHE